MSTARTGEQHRIAIDASTGPIEAVVTGVGAGLRILRVNGVDIVPPYGEAEARPFGSGLVLVPWPNRVADGRWTAPDGSVQQLDLTEPARGNAIHGLLRYAEYAVADAADDRVRLRARVVPQHGYDYALDTEVEYRLVSQGVEVTHVVVNRSDVPAPVAIGAHPFVTIGDAAPEDLVLTLACATHVDVDAERLLPTGTRPVDGTPFDLRGGRRLGDLDLDDGYADAEMRAGVSEHTLASPDGRTVTVWGDESFPYWQVFTTAEYPGQRIAVAVEPMTAPVDALNSGDGLRWLEPGERLEARWGIRADGFTGV